MLLCRKEATFCGPLHNHKKRRHLLVVLGAASFVMARLATNRAEDDPLPLALMRLADSLRLWAPRLPVDDRGFDVFRNDRLHVHRDDADLVDGTERPDAALVKAQRLDVDMGRPRCRTRMDARVSEVLELLA